MATTIIQKHRFKNARPLDIIYDPVFEVSDEKDYNRAINKSMGATAEFVLRPNYTTMFGDNPRYPNSTLVIKFAQRMPRYVDTSYGAKTRARSSVVFDVSGADRCKFFNNHHFVYEGGGKLTMRLLFISQLLISAFQGAHPEVLEHEKPEIGLESAITDGLHLRHQKGDAAPPSPTTHFIYRRRSTGTQTDYREAETQTKPWTPPFTVIGSTTPEVLLLGYLSWGEGLPAGRHEVEVIERARIRRAWEANMPPPISDENIERRNHIIEDMEMDDWVFREEEIQAIHDIRMELATKQLHKHGENHKDRLKLRLERLTARHMREKHETIKKIRQKRDRDLRRMAMRHKASHRSESNDKLFALMHPVMKKVEKKEVINIRSKFLQDYKGLTMLETVNIGIVPAFDYIKASKPKTNYYTLCERETRWTEQNLAQLHKDVIDLSRKEPVVLSQHMFQRRYVEIPMPPTPSGEAVSDKEENLYQSAVFLQKLIRGRAVQTEMYEGRAKFQELIDELKSTHALQEQDLLIRKEERRNMVIEPDFEVKAKEMKQKVINVLNSFEGQTVGQQFDFLSKELLRLQDERRVHALALLAERERWRREAAEAGRRQEEERRRREHDEIFKQVVKVHQDTIDMYLEDVIIESIDWLAEDEARAYIKETAKRIDEAARKAHTRDDQLMHEELVAELVHSFMVPEVSKASVRRRMCARQAKYLQAAHELVYARTEDLSAPCSPLPDIAPTPSQPITRDSLKFPIVRPLQIHVSDETLPHEEEIENESLTAVRSVLEGLLQDSCDLAEEAASMQKVLPAMAAERILRDLLNTVSMIIKTDTEKMIQELIEKEIVSSIVGSVTYGMIRTFIEEEINMMKFPPDDEIIVTDIQLGEETICPNLPNQGDE